MSAKYVEVPVSASGYSGAGVTAQFETLFHTYLALGPSGSDVIVSWDGINDHAKIRAPGAAGVVAPLNLGVAYRSVWMRTTSGLTGSVGVGLYSR